MKTWRQHRCTRGWRARRSSTADWRDEGDLVAVAEGVVVVLVLLVNGYDQPGGVPRKSRVPPAHFLGQVAHRGTVGQPELNLRRPGLLSVAGEKSDGNSQGIDSSTPAWENYSTGFTQVPRTGLGDLSRQREPDCVRMCPGPESGSARGLPADGVCVAAGVGAALQHARFLVHHDRGQPTHGGRPFVKRLHVVAAACELGHGVA